MSERPLARLVDGLVAGQLLVMALVLRIATRFATLPVIVRVLERASGTSPFAGFPILRRQTSVERLCALAARVSRVAKPGGPCLLDSLLRFWVTRSAGRPGRLLIGVRKSAGALEAHAWLESPGLSAPSATATAPFRVIASW